MDFLKLTWDDFEKFIEDFIKYCLEKDKHYTGVYGLPRGGSVIATTLSHRLDIPFLGAPCSGCLVVDDIHDSGISLAHYYQCGYDVVTWCYIEPLTPINVPKYFHKKIDGYGKPWVVFRWEKRKA